MDLLSVPKLSSDKDEIYKPIFAARLLISHISLWIFEILCTILCPQNAPNTEALTDAFN